MENEELLNTESSASDVELSHSDKAAGIFTEPANTFETTAKFSLRTADWLIPVILVLLVTIISQFILWSNAEIKYNMEEKQRAALQEMIDQGKMTQEQVDQQAKFMSGTFGHIVRSVSILIFGFVFFLIISGIYFLFSKFVLKGDGGYSSSLVANGLTIYIGILHIIIATVLSLLLGRMIQDVSITSLLNMDKASFLGWLLSFVDVISIWTYAVLSIGLAKMFKAQSASKYFIMVFGLWILWKLIVFGLGNTLPLLKNF